MEIQKLDKVTFLPDDLVEGWTSAIWTERHKDFGDFQLKTPRISEMMDVLPEGSLIALRDSPEVMMVESHAISENKKVEELTITGRTLDAFLQNRFLTGPYHTPWPMQINYTIQDAIAVLIWNCIVNPTVLEVIRPYPWDHLLRDNIPNVVVTDSVKVQIAPTGKIDDLQTAKEWWLETGNIYPQITNFLNLGGNLGIRVIRPQSISDARGVAVSPDGTVVHAEPGSFSDLRFDIYNGRNRTNAPSALDPLPSTVFSHEAGHIEDPNHLFSIKDKKNLIHMQTSITSIEVYIGETGLDLYGEWYDGGSIDNTIDPEDFEVKITQDALAEFNKRKRQQLVEAAISANAPYSYGRYEEGGDYYLGDLVEVVGKYGIKNVMQVNEYIRTEDKKNGEKSYPTLIVPQ